MPIANYSVLAGRPTAAAKLNVDSGAILKITVEANGGPFSAVVNVQSTTECEVLYAVVQGCTPPKVAGLRALPLGLTELRSEPGGLALDYVRQQIDGEPMITRDRMMRIPTSPQPDAEGISPEEWAGRTAAASALEHALLTLIKITMEDEDGLMYALGSGSADLNDGSGIGRIHMNQGHPMKQGHPGGKSNRDNGIWQDGAVFFHVPSRQIWVGVFVAFEAQSWRTDSAGNPV
jgi:uncharacterized protein YukJ